MDPTQITVTVKKPKCNLYNSDFSESGGGPLSLLERNKLRPLEWLNVHYGEYEIMSHTMTCQIKDTNQ